MKSVVRDYPYVHKSWWNHAIGFFARGLSRAIVFVWHGVGIVQSKGPFPKGPAVYVCNHASHLDTGILTTVLFFRSHKLRVLAAKDHFFEPKEISATASKTQALIVRTRNKLVPWAVSTFYNAIPVSRDTTRTSMQVRKLIRVVRSGVSVIIFPEGTRSRTGEIGAFELGAAALAQMANVPVVPMALHGAGSAWSVGSSRLLRRRVKIVRGTELVHKEGESPEQFTRRIEKVVQGLKRDLETSITRWDRCTRWLWPWE